MANKDWVKIEGSGGPAWDYKAQKEIEGVYTGTQENVGPNNSRMHYLETANHEIVGVWGNAVLDGKFRAVKPGEEVKVVYLGDAVSPKTKRTYHNFDVYHVPLEAIAEGVADEVAKKV